MSYSSAANAAERRRIGRCPRFVARATAIFSIALAAVAGWGFASAVAAGEPEWSEPSYGAEGSGGPNVYVVLLDGYPRADTLHDTFGRGNEEFIADLQSRGFDISDQARANYNKTWLTLASMFNGTYIDRMLVDGRVPEDAPSQVRWLSGMIRASDGVGFVPGPRVHHPHRPDALYIDGADIR